MAYKKNDEKVVAPKKLTNNRPSVSAFLNLGYDGGGLAPFSNAFNAIFKSSRNASEPRGPKSPNSMKAARRETNK